MESRTHPDMTEAKYRAAESAIASAWNCIKITLLVSCGILAEFGHM